MTVRKPNLQDCEWKFMSFANVVYFLIVIFVMKNVVSKIFRSHIYIYIYMKSVFILIG